MDLRRIFYLIIIVFMPVISHVHGQQLTPIVIGVPEFKPYTYLENGVLTGTAIKQMQPIFDALPEKVTLRQYSNYSLLLKALKADEIQGFFLASQNTERDRYAIFTKPLAFNNWSWFTLRENEFDFESADFKYTSTVATTSKTNTFRWLTRNGFQVHSSSITQLPSLLLNKKVNAVFSAENVFLQACKDQGIHPKSFHKTLHESRPFGMYISKKYSETNPDFIKTLNSLIKDI